MCLTLIFKEENLMLVFVLNKHGKPLMPCKPKKARLLLKDGKAKVIKKTPFTIQLLYGSTGHKQNINLGVDSGFNHVGLSAVSESKELYSAEVQLRTNMVKLNSERRMYRRTRRGRKARYRKPRFLNRKRPEGWLAPSIQHKFNSHIKLINRIKKFLPVSKIIVEVATFDVQKIKNPNIESKGYQQGEQLDFWNVREYVFHRDNHNCQACKGKSKDKTLNVHHIESRQVGGNRPDNLITLCETCHTNFHKGEIKLNLKKRNGFKAETFMSIVRWKLVNTLRDLGENIKHTYGYITKNNRIINGIEKSHSSDAFVIAGGTNQNRSINYFIKQVRKNNRKLFKGIRSHIKNTAPRFIHNFQRYDKVLWKNQECFIFGRRKTGYFDLRKLDCKTKLHSSAKSKDLTLLERFNTLLTEIRFPPRLNQEIIDGVSNGET